MMIQDLWSLLFHLFILFHTLFVVFSALFPHTLPRVSSFVLFPCFSVILHIFNRLLAFSWVPHLKFPQSYLLFPILHFSPLFISLHSLFSGASLTPFIHLSSRQWLRFQRLLYMLHSLPTSHPYVFSSPLPPQPLFSFPSLSSLFCLILTYHPRGVIDNRGEGDLVEGSFWLVVKEMKRRSLLDVHCKNRLSHLSCARFDCVFTGGTLVL